MTEVVVLPEAVKDIQRIFDFLINKNPLAAQKAILAIDDGISRLIELPYAGIAMPLRPEYREHFVKFGKASYILRYRFDEKRDRVVVIRIWHSLEDRP